jgi:hypothetical protein
MISAAFVAVVVGAVAGVAVTGAAELPEIKV